ncbi:DUF1415 domain-containing protein [Aliidiomarina soli]|uniref:DUF1415 domain-containing protein n=1 Tax=Aliidiomarina soli TaxID=1928574 RepID=UPI0030840CAF
MRFRSILPKILSSSDSQAIAKTRHWVETFIVPLNICPFARREVERASIRYQPLAFSSDNEFYDALLAELNLLQDDSELETTLLILPQLDDSFDAFLNTAGYAEQIIALEGFTGTYQIAHFHPEYIFADSDQSDAANYTNRAPHACLHLLREASLERAIRAHKQAEQIPADNIKKLRQLGLDRMQQQFRALCDAPQKHREENTD